VAIYTEDVLEIHTDVQGFAYQPTKNPTQGKKPRQKGKQAAKGARKTRVRAKSGAKKRLNVKELGARGFELVSLPSQLLIFICLVISSIPFLQVACCQAERSFELPYK